MTIDKQAKLLLKHGSWENYIDKVFEECNLDDEEIIDEIQQALVEKTPPYSIRENWDNDVNIEDFSQSGYTNEDIEYETIDEAYEQNIEDVLEEVAWTICSKVFSSDFFHQYIVDYIRRYI